MGQYRTGWGSPTWWAAPRQRLQHVFRAGVRWGLQEATGHVEVSRREVARGSGTWRGHKSYMSTHDAQVMCT